MNAAARIGTGSPRQWCVQQGVHQAMRCRAIGERMAYSLTEAAGAAGRNRSSILRAIKSGRLSATRDEVTGEWRIEPVELHRLYPVADASGAAPGRNNGAPAEIQELRARLADKDTTITEQRTALDDLRRRLDQADTDRRQALDRLAAAQERITALLTDQRATPPAGLPARRSWWRWPHRAS
jgi:hypothetical protein